MDLDNPSGELKRKPAADEVMELAASLAARATSINKTASTKLQRIVRPPSPLGGLGMRLGRATDHFPSLFEELYQHLSDIENALDGIEETVNATDL